MEVSGKRHETEIPAEICEPCLEESHDNPADGFCTDCEEFMCQKCFRHHLKAKSCRQHVLGSLQEESSKRKQETEKCKKHTTENIKYFCKTHYSVACGDCLVFEHRKCEPEFIKDVAKNFEESSEFKTFLGQIHRWETDTAESENRIASNQKENKTILESAITSIRIFRKDINDWLDKMEKDLETEVRKIYDDNETKMHQLEERISSVRKAINKIKEELDANVYGADNLFIRKVRFKPNIDNVDKTLFDIKSKNVIRVYTFEPETKVKEMVASLKMGIINVTCKANTEKKQTGENGSAAANIYQLPDPRAVGFGVGKEAKVIEGAYKGSQGIVCQVDPSGYVWMSFVFKSSISCTSKYKAGAEGKYDVKLL